MLLLGSGKMEINNLEKKYGKKLVLDIKNIEFGIKGIIGILGINGAGKTTFFKVMTDLAHSNQISKYKYDISYFPDADKFYNTNILGLGELIRLTYSDFDVDDFYKILLELGLTRDTKIRQLSRGQKNLLNIVMTICRDTQYYFIDELYSNLDFETRELISKIIIEYTDVKNKLIFISSHEIEDVERLLDFVVVLHDKDFGKVYSQDYIIKKYKNLYNWFENEVTGGIQ